MKPSMFPQANKALLRPAGMTEEECGNLYVWTDGQQCLSLWQMDWRERVKALWYGRIWLTVLSGQTQPPVELSADRTIFIEEAGS